MKGRNHNLMRIGLCWLGLLSAQSSQAFFDNDRNSHGRVRETYVQCESQNYKPAACDLGLDRDDQVLHIEVNGAPLSDGDSLTGRGLCEDSARRPYNFSWSDTTLHVKNGCRAVFLVTYESRGGSTQKCDLPNWSNQARGEGVKVNGRCEYRRCDSGTRPYEYTGEINVARVDGRPPVYYSGTMCVASTCTVNGQAGQFIVGRENCLNHCRRSFSRWQEYESKKWNYCWFEQRFIDQYRQ